MNKDDIMHFKKGTLREEFVSQLKVIHPSPVYYLWPFLLICNNLNPHMDK